MAEAIMLVLTADGARKRRIPFATSAGWEALRSKVVREFDAAAIAEISYSIDDEVFAIAGDDSLRGYLQEKPLPPLKVTLLSKDLVCYIATFPNGNLILIFPQPVIHHDHPCAFTTGCDFADSNSSHNKHGSQWSHNIATYTNIGITATRRCDGNNPGSSPTNTTTVTTIAHPCR
ncbi:hypothetical protein PAPYR_10863 [Paratrimastix pyriformis]|uniref:Uncharacterized protein n=1 Tax=Paratrimastix pyriformis TaxID=342808 RepID=A0ABQ8UAV0_9EUKA|nr:hypothetical protein PAPYR_10863 [Paratrimastix pyriformis]